MKKLMMAVLTAICLCGMSGCKPTPVTVPTTKEARHTDERYQKALKVLSSSEREYLELWIRDHEQSGGVPANISIKAAVDIGRNMQLAHFARIRAQAADPNYQPPIADWERCGRDLECLYKEYVIKAHGQCMDRIRDRQTADMKGAGGVTFEWHEWASKNPNDRRFKMGGDQLLMQNEYGAYIRYEYSCTYNPKNNTARLNYFRPF